MLFNKHMPLVDVAKCNKTVTFITPLKKNLRKKNKKP